MDVLIKPNDGILLALGRQARFKNKNYRLNQFLLIEDIMGGKLIHNQLTASLIFLTNKEFEKIYDKESNEPYIKFLYDAYFLVEENFDERAFVKEFRAKMAPPVDDYCLNTISEYTILTTTACNARCFYCYEQKVKKSVMTEETALKVADFIVKKAPKNSPIELRWFGGEPLFNMKVINTICKHLQENNVKYTSFFTTNGYLFDKDIIKKAKELWHITSCQITLDGTEYVYNKAKNYIYSDPSPYKRVLDNIEELINNKVGVMIRMNVDMHNADNLKELVYELYGRFGNNKYLTPYCYPIFENEFFQRNEGERAIVFQKIAEIEEILNECRMYTGTSVRGNIRIGHCMVDNGRAITISPNGDFGLCEHYVDTDFWGHVDRPDEMDMDMIRSWRVYEEDLDICSDCPIYPRCVRASKCEEQSKCYPEYKEWLIRKAKMGIKTTYYSIMDDRNKRR
jgi:radical SAM protein with 4Fe4S-binding SPASM domain